MMLRDYPEEEKPREKVIRYGVDSLSNVELLALILRTGSKKESVISLAQRVINHYGGLPGLSHADYATLNSIYGISKARAVEIMALGEIAKRMSTSYVNKQQITCSRDGYEYIRSRYLFEQQEKVILLCLNNHLEVMKEKVVFVGTVDASFFSGKEIFKEVIQCGASAMMIFHNHPSGKPFPSKEDREATKVLKEMSVKLQILWIDHIIIGENSYYSFESDKVYNLTS